VGWGDAAFRVVLTGFAATIPLLFVALVARLTVSAWPTIRAFGVRFLTTSTWDPVANVYGAAPMIFGTLFSSLIALLLAVPLAIGVAIFLTEFAPRWLRGPVGTLVELLAAIPSVVYGLWGIFVLIPLLRAYVVPPLGTLLGWTPFFSGTFYGNSMLAAGIILAVMILPYISSEPRGPGRGPRPSARRPSPSAPPAEAVERRAAVRPGRHPGAIVLGLGRALGETMAVVMVIGNRHDLSVSLVEPGITMAAVIANEFNEAAGLQRAALFEVGLVLFGVTVAVNALARLLVWRVARGSAVGSRAI
jgi:phosphate transport system permease protein